MQKLIGGMLTVALLGLPLGDPAQGAAGSGPTEQAENSNSQDVKRAARQTARALVAAERVVWTGDAHSGVGKGKRTFRKHLAHTAQGGRRGSTYAEFSTGDAVAGEVLDLAAELRDSVYDAGLEVQSVEISLISVDVPGDMDSGAGDDATALIERAWEEYDPQTGQAVPVSMEAVYNLHLDDSGNQSTIASAEEAPEGASEDNGESLVPGEVVPSPSADERTSTVQNAPIEDDGAQATEPSDDDDGSTFEPSTFARYLREMNRPGVSGDFLV